MLFVWGEKYIRKGEAPPPEIAHEGSNPSPGNFGADFVYLLIKILKMYNIFINYNLFSFPLTRPFTPGSGFIF
jgi:hypothetical protein